MKWTLINGLEIMDIYFVGIKRCPNNLFLTNKHIDV